jgi:hypothetical protein
MDTSTANMLSKISLQQSEALTKGSLARWILAEQLKALRTYKNLYREDIALGFDTKCSSSWVNQAQSSVDLARIILEYGGYKSVNRKDK